MLAIVIIAYRNPDLIRLQIERMPLFCKEEYELIVVDNSPLAKEKEAIKYHSGPHYISTNASSQGGSSSHSFAANFSFMRLSGKYSHYLYLDHDCFPVKEFTIDSILQGKHMAGVGQQKKKTYLWPGCLMWDASKVDSLYINFSPNGELGLDTGGELYRVVEKYGQENIRWMNEEYHENPSFNKSQYNFYSTICDNTFMHFINGSNWNNANDDQERINSLINILTK